MQKRGEKGSSSTNGCEGKKGKARNPLGRQKLRSSGGRKKKGKPLSCGAREKGKEEGVAGLRPNVRNEKRSGAIL